METPLKVYKGLEGIYVLDSSLSFIDTENGKLYYVGYDVEELVARSNYEEVAYLLLNHKLPTMSEFSAFLGKLRDEMRLGEEELEVVRFVSKRSGGMDALAAYFIMTQKDAVGEVSPMDSAVRAVGKAGSVLGNVIRVQRGDDTLNPDPSLGIAGNLVYLITSEKPQPYQVEFLDDILILHAEHGVPASTFGSVVTASTLSNVYSSIVTGIMTLKGPLHGGAAEAAYQQFLEIGDPDRVESWLERALSERRRIMGFGHRVYKIYDPRAKVVKAMAAKASEIAGGHVKNLYEIALRLEEAALAKLAPKGLFPNLDFWTPMVYTAVGIPPNYFTAVFAVSRIVGWVAHLLEYWKDNRLIRPLHNYVGPPVGQKYVPIEARH
ncbi:MAG: citrate/2-methylcitrate synthase [Thaumarchaeota archaeon]|nr:citrate/2-methylcitrate synthase [Candidatus Calditenuaceae archaeon]MDW8042210.1 citrate/2-methylcitrate synthase [Nitrososphaerota archaeon]